MNETIIGVIIGAFLGGFAQVTNDWIQSKRDRKKLRRDERREAYVALLRSINDARRAFAYAHSVWDDDPEALVPKADLDTAHEAVSEAKTNERLIYLISPHATWISARDIVRGLERLSVNAAFADDDLRKAELAFTKRAKHDLSEPGRVNWGEVRRRRDNVRRRFHLP